MTRGYYSVEQKQTALKLAIPRQATLKVCDISSCSFLYNI
jgi:hypothetical protein